MAAGDPSPIREGGAPGSFARFASNQWTTVPNQIVYPTLARGARIACGDFPAPLDRQPGGRANLTYCTNHGDRRLGRFREAAGPLAVVFQAAPQIVMTNAGSRSKTLPRCRKNCAQTRRIRQDQPLQLPFIVNRQYDSHGLAAARDDHRAALRGPEVGAETSLDVGHRSDFRSGISSLPMRRHQPRALSNCLTHIELAGILACPWMVLRARRDAGNSVAAPDSAYHSLLAGPLSAKSASPQR